MAGKLKFAVIQVWAHLHYAVPDEILEGGGPAVAVPTTDARTPAAAIESALGEAADRTALQRRGHEFSLQRAGLDYLRSFGIHRAANTE